jgi:hypothetical protein
MHPIVKSALFGLGLVVATGLAAHAQSVSSLPPSGGTGQSAYTQPYGSTQSYFPKPGGSETLKQEPSSAPSAANTDRNFAPYSKSIGPKPN